MSRWSVLGTVLMLLSCQRELPKSPANVPAAPGELNVQLAINPDPPIEGDNHLLVDVRDAAGAPVDNAEIKLTTNMPAMGAMPEMKGKGESHALGRGHYDVTYPLPMAGDWTLSLDVTAPSFPQKHLSVKVAPPRKGFVIERQGPAGGAAAAGQASAAVGRVLEVAPERQQLIGVTFATVDERPLSVAARAAGRIEVDERQLSDVTLKYEAYVRALYVAETGKNVREGAPLLQLYSPELLAAEEELLQARRAAGTHAPGADEIIRGALRRLRLWDLTDAQIGQLEKSEKADGTLIIHSPASGVVLEKNVVEGTRVTPGTVLYRIGNLGRVWIQADFHEEDAPWIAVGQPATISLPAFGGQEQHGRVSFVSPTLDEKTRTLRARIELQNAKLLLKPGMFVDVDVEVPLGNRLAVPDSALILSGEHRYAFVEKEPGRLLPVDVQLGATAGDYDEVRTGLQAGDRVVVGANFLISSEAQLRDALPRWSAP